MSHQCVTFPVIVFHYYSELINVTNKLYFTNKIAKNVKCIIPSYIIIGMTIKTSEPLVSTC